MLVPRSRREFVASLLGLAIPTTLRAWPVMGWEPPSFSPEKRVARGTQVAATVHPLATQAAQWCFTQGGNAIDAVVSASLALSVVDGHNSGIGGGCFILLHASNGESFAIDGREVAPQAATADMYLREGRPQTELSQTGPLASGVPGQVHALDALHHRFGKLPWETLFEPAIQYAEQGYEIGRSTWSAMQSEVKQLQQFSASAKILLQADGSVPSLGTRWKQTDLAESLKRLAKEGAGWFYEGGFAEQVASYMKAAGGILTRDDFKRYRTVWREPLKSTYRQYQIVGFPPPSSGGVHIAQMLNMLERFPLRDYARDNPSLYYHVIAESMKLAFADRAYWLGDPDHVAVPRRLVDRRYTDALSQLIQEERATLVKGHGEPPEAGSALFEGDREATDSKKHTTHLTAVDRDGNWVAMTATVNTTWGSKVIVPGTGIMLNNQMDDFSIAPGTPNAFGLVGAQANAIAPGKRPLSSMSPTIVLDGQGPMLTCGAAGGPRIINAVLQTMLGCLDGDKDIAQSLASPRIHHQWRPDELLVEPDLPKSVVESLEQKGHAVKGKKGLAVAQGIQRSAGQLMAASDPRVEGQSLSDTRD